GYKTYLLIHKIALTTHGCGHSSTLLVYIQEILYQINLCVEMKIYILICAIILQVGWSYGEPRGVGAYAYEDSSGNRYGGTYGLDDAQVYHDAGQFPNYISNFWSADDFFPDYFNNLEGILREAFQSNIENQKLAFNAAKKAYDLTTNQAGFIPNFTSRFSDLGLGAFSGLQSPAMNRAYAGGAVGPDFTHQVAGISPNNPNVPNVNVMTRFADANNPGDGGFYSVSSSSFVSSSNIDGKEQSHRKAETMVNRNGQITKYKVES
ncbi:hypothetical protein ACJJTC_015567, partial [Scirpophaga incertulas]